MRTLIVALALFCATLAEPADVLDGWRHDQSMIEAQLQKRDYAGARKAAIKLANRIVDRFVASGEASRLLANTALLRAAAEEGLHHSDDATWYRQVAAALDPPIEALAKKDSPPSPAVGSPLTPNMKPPEYIRRQPPVRPGIIDVIGASTVTVRARIDVDGIVRQPGIVDSPSPAVSYAALEGFHQWRFRPGSVDGKPVSVIFNLTVTFH